MTASADKSEIRQRVLAARDAVDPRVRSALALRVTARLLELPEYRKADCVMAYCAFGSEFDTTAFIADALARGKSLVLPRVERVTRALQLYRVHDPASQLAPGIWGIREPMPGLCPEAHAGSIEFLLAPGVAFTPACDRLGYGGGFYDRLIAGFSAAPFFVAAAFALQILPELPVTATDRALDLVVTEERVYSRR